MLGTAVLHLDDGDNPPDWCFDTDEFGNPSTCTWDGTAWHKSYDDGGFGSDGSGMVGFFVVFFIVALIAGIGITVWKVSAARRMAEQSGMNKGDATAMTLLTDSGFEATYLAANLRPQGQAPAAPPAPVPAAAADRLRELQGLLDQGLVTQAEYDARRQAIIDGV